MLIKGGWRVPAWGVQAWWLTELDLRHRVLRHEMPVRGVTALTKPILCYFCTWNRSWMQLKCYRIWSRILNNTTWCRRAARDDVMNDGVVQSLCWTKRYMTLGIQTLCWAKWYMTFGYRRCAERSDTWRWGTHVVLGEMVHDDGVQTLCWTRWRMTVEYRHWTGRSNAWQGWNCARVRLKAKPFVCFNIWPVPAPLYGWLIPSHSHRSHRNNRSVCTAYS